MERPRRLHSTSSCTTVHGIRSAAGAQGASCRATRLASCLQAKQEKVQGEEKEVTLAPKLSKGSLKMLGQAGAQMRPVLRPS